MNAQVSWDLCYGSEFGPSFSLSTKCTSSETQITANNWIPAADLTRLNASLVGTIEVLAQFHNENDALH